MRHCPTPKNRLREFLPANLAEFDSLLSQVISSTNVRAGHCPAGIWEDEGSYHVELDMPGVSRDNVDITFDKGTLTVSAERKHEDSENTRKGWREERFYGKVTRSFTMPDTIDPDSISAQMNDGVLHMTVAKSPAAQPRKVEIK
jgi:HSP20 family protein